MASSNKIFLVGFMGCGKSTLAKKLATKLNFIFFDLDGEIERAEKLSINEIFEKFGETYFRVLENRILNKIIANNESFVMSLGGGTPCFQDNMNMINHSGTSVYLGCSASVLTSRLMNAKTKRPLIKNLNENDLKEFIEDKLIEREVFYNKSKYKIKGDNLKLEDLIDLLQ